MIVLLILKYLEKLKFHCIFWVFLIIFVCGVFFVLFLFFLHKALLKFDNHRCIGDER